MGGPFTPWECIIWFTEPILWFKLCFTCQWWTKLLSTLYIYFCKTLKRHLEFTKLVEVMETKGVKSLKHYGLVCYPLPKVLCQNKGHYWWKRPFTSLVMKKQKQTLTSYVMCKSCWGLLPYFPCYSLFTISSSSTSWRMFLSVISW
jgi:hypothetical protein